MKMKLCMLIIVVAFASDKNDKKSAIVKTEEYIKGTDYVKVNNYSSVEDILEFEKNGWENENVYAWAHAAGTELSQLLFEENLENKKVCARLNYIEAKFSLLRFEKKMGYLGAILAFKKHHTWDGLYPIGPEMIHLLKAGRNYEDTDIDKQSILSEMEHLEEILEFKTHGWKNEQINTCVHNIGAEFINLLKTDENYQGIFEALRADLDDWHKMKPNSNEYPYGKVFFINQNKERYALYTSGVTRKWTLFKFQRMVKLKFELLSKSKLHYSLKLKMIQIFYRLGKWEKVMEDANVSLSLKKMTINIENGDDEDNEEKIEIERNFLPLQRTRMMHEFDKIQKFKKATRISDEDLEKYTRAAYYEEYWYGFYEIEKVCYKESTGKYKVTFKDDPNTKFQVHENELFAGDIDVGHEVIVKDPKEKEDRIGFVTEIVVKGVDPPKLWYDIEWKEPIDKTTSSMVRKTEIVALYSTQKRKREPSPEKRELEQHFNN